MKYLIIAPHADDELLGCGGTVNKLLCSGEEVYLLVCSTRHNDLAKYKDIFSLFTDYFELPFEDEKLHRYNLLKSIEPIYNKIKPHTIFIPNKDDFNLDHQEVYQACQVVLRRFQTYQPSKILMYETPSSTTQSFNNNFKCNYYVQLDKQDLKFKIDTFKKYKNELRQYPNPRSAEGILAYAKFRGMECNSLYAEGFNLIYEKS
tara:strand:+ start:8425 stop:9036 length:612 start_codon:yes stop_codon:yes gene_type:complete